MKNTKETDDKKKERTGFVTDKRKKLLLVLLSEILKKDQSDIINEALDGYFNRKKEEAEEIKDEKILSVFDFVERVVD
jgi:hypothetical protein